MSDNSKYDDYWDISKLIPKKKKSLSAFSSSPAVNDVVVGKDSDSADSSAETKLSFSAYRTANDEKEPYSYVPTDSSIIKRVTINPSRDRFDFYDTFRKAALIYYDYKCPRCPFVPFYSYKPQYSQMSTEQKKYYFYWRDEVRHGNYIKTDYSYIYLLAYEILNLPDKISKEEGLESLCKLYVAYCKDFNRLAVSFSSWIQDYCLVYELECPHEMLEGNLIGLIGATDFKEFYLSKSISTEEGTDALLAYLSDYNWRGGKYASVGNTDSYKTHICSAMGRVFARLLGDNLYGGGGVARISRQAFPGSLCTHSVKCYLDVEYRELSSSPAIRIAVTDAVKYCENKIRALTGIKSRLSVKNLDEKIKRIIDTYFEAEFAKAQKKRERENAPEYEKLYDAPDADSEISLRDAIDIERASWKNTEKLIEGQADYADDLLPVFDSADGAFSDPPVSADATPTQDSVQSGESDLSGNNDLRLSYAEVKFLRAAAVSDIADMKRICIELNLSAYAVAERINEAFYDMLGDVVLEDTGEHFSVIEDYLEEVLEWLKSTIQ